MDQEMRTVMRMREERERERRCQCCCGVSLFVPPKKMGTHTREKIKRSLDMCLVSYNLLRCIMYDVPYDIYLPYDIYNILIAPKHKNLFKKGFVIRYYLARYLASHRRRPLW